MVQASQSKNRSLPQAALRTSSCLLVIAAYVVEPSSSDIRCLMKKSRRELVCIQTRQQEGLCGTDCGLVCRVDDDDRVI